MNHNYKHDNGMELEVTCTIPGCTDETLVGQIEQVIPAIAEMIAEQMMDEYDDPICMVLMPDGATAILTISEAEDSFGKMGEDFFVHDDLVILRCASENVVTVGGQCYLVGPAMIIEMDEDGNECSIDAESVSNAMEFFEENITEMQIDGSSYPAVRLM